MLFEQHRVVETRVDFRAGENDQAAAAPEIILDRHHRRLGKLRHIRQQHHVVIIQPRLGEFRRRNDRALDEIILEVRRGHGLQRMAQEEGLGLARFPRRIAIDEQRTHFANRPHRQHPLIVAAHPVLGNPRGHRVKSFRAEPRKHRHAARGTRRQRRDVHLVARRLAIHAQRHANVPRLVLPVIGHLHLETQRPVRRRQARDHRQRTHAEIALLVITDQNNMRLHFLRAAGLARLLENLLHVGHLPPAVGLAVGEQVNLLPNRQPVAERFQRALDARINVARPVRQLRLAHHFAREIQIVRRLGDDRLRHIRREEHRRRRSRRQRINRLLRRLARLVEARLHPVAHAHARGIVEQQHRRHLRLTEHLVRGTAHRGPREREREQQQQQATQQQQQQILDLHPPLVLLQAGLDEPHRRPDHRLEFPLVQQVDDDGDDHRARAEQQKWIEK